MKKEIDISKLSKGNVVKNYKTMCSLLGQPVAEGNLKQSQINNWERYFDFEKQGQKFIITEIYDKPKEVVDLRKCR